MIYYVKNKQKIKKQIYGVRSIQQLNKATLPCAFINNLISKGCSSTRLRCSVLLISLWVFTNKLITTQKTQTAHLLDDKGPFTRISYLVYMALLRK